MTTLVIAAAIVVAIIGARVAALPVSPAALARFSSRHKLIVPPASPALVTYLAVTRHWRTAGVSIALVVSLVVRLNEQRVQIDTVALVAGWLVHSLPRSDFGASRLARNPERPVTSCRGC